MTGKITELTATLVPTDNDLVEIVQDVPTTPVNKKITIANFRKITAVPSTDLTVSGTIIQLTANENQAFGDVCFIGGGTYAGKAVLGNANAIATASCIAICADATIDADASGNYLLRGIVRDDTWNWTVGGLIYLSTTGTTGNTLTQTAPSGTDDVVQILGIATNADRIYFNPQLVQVEHT